MTRHLTPAQIRAAVSDFVQSGDNPERAVSQHLAECDDCLCLVLAASIGDIPLDSRPADQASECPTVSQWASLAAANVSSKERMDLLAHAADCDCCRQILAEWLREPDESPESGWDPVRTRHVAAQMASAAESSTTRKPPHSLPGGPRTWWVIAAALLLCAGVAAWLIKARLFETTPPFEMLAEAFTSQPVTELRFPRAQYGGDVKRSRGGSRLDAPRTLLEADPRIARGVDEHPEDASWLQAKGLAEFLHRDFEEARRDLEKALLLRPGDAELEESEAMTWFELGETLGEPTDYAKAVDLFGKALRTRPDDATAQYNYALALERMQLYHESLAAWKRYLAADSSSKWAQQARRHSEEIEKKLKAQSEGSMLHIEPGDPPVMEALHTAFGPATAATSAREAARRKLDEWAANFQRDYRDDWLAQLLIDSARPGFGAAEELLYSAFENTQSGNPEAAKNYAIKARMAYQALGSEAGTARAQFELTYALQFALGMRDCLEESRRLDAMAAPHRFTWLLVQAKLEEFMALAALDETLAAQQAVRRAVQLATESSLKTLYLRGICSEG
jgi:tetratricopeptide (TPR) repeat protein